MELPFSALAQPGGDGNCGSAIRSRNGIKWNASFVEGQPGSYFRAWNCRYVSSRQSGAGG
jgi:hypothetical protein